MRIAVLPNPRASGVREALPRVCAALRKLGAEVLLPGEGDAFPSPNADALIRESDVTAPLSIRLNARPFAAGRSWGSTAAASASWRGLRRTSSSGCPP